MIGETGRKREREASMILHVKDSTQIKKGKQKDVRCEERLRAERKMDNE